MCATHTLCGLWNGSLRSSKWEPGGIHTLLDIVMPSLTLCLPSLTFIGALLW